MIFSYPCKMRGQLRWFRHVLWRSTTKLVKGHKITVARPTISRIGTKT